MTRSPGRAFQAAGRRAGPGGTPPPGPADPGRLSRGRPTVRGERVPGRGGPRVPPAARRAPHPGRALALLLLPLCSVLGGAAGTRHRGPGAAAGAGVPGGRPHPVHPEADRSGARRCRPGVRRARGRDRARAASCGRPAPSMSGGSSGVLAGCELDVEEGGFASPAEVARALLEAQPRTQLLPTKEGGEQPPLLLVDESEREKPGDVLGQYRLERHARRGRDGPRLPGAPREPGAAGGGEGAPGGARRGTVTSSSASSTRRGR